jgi:hypothetical protein
MLDRWMREGYVARSVVTRSPDRAPVEEALRVVHSAWVDQQLAELRWQDARTELARAEARVREAEFAYERACRG